MEKSQGNAIHLVPVNKEKAVSFDESVCSAEFTEGCTLPVSEQLNRQ